MQNERSRFPADRFHPRAEFRLFMYRRSVFFAQPHPGTGSNLTPRVPDPIHLESSMSSSARLARAPKNHPPPTRFIAKRRTTQTVAKTTRRCCFFARRLCPFLRTAFCWAAAIVVVVVVVVVPSFGFLCRERDTLFGCVSDQCFQFQK